MGSLDQDLLVDSTNILILQDVDFPNLLEPGIFEEPNDSNEGGALTFDFSPANFNVGINLIDVIDVDNNAALTLTLTDAMGRTRIVQVPDQFTGDITLGEPGIATIDFAAGPQESPNIAGLFTEVFTEGGFTLGNVMALDVDFVGSAALDNLVFVPEPATALLLAVGLAIFARRRR